MWVWYNFRTQGPDFDRTAYGDGAMRLTAYWLGRRGMNFDNQQFVIKVKRFERAEKWEHGKLSKALSQPWQDAGSASWVDGEFQFSMMDVESL